MKKYNLKTDIKNISYSLTLILTIFLVFSIFSVIIIFPLYFYSKTYPKIYSLAASFLLLSVLLFFLIKWLFKIWNKYKKIKPFLIHLLLSPFIVCFILILLAFEFIIFKFIEYLFFTNTGNTGLFYIIQVIIYILTGIILFYNIYFSLLVILSVIELFAFKLLFELFPFITALSILIFINILLIAGIILLRILIHNIKLYLKIFLICD